MTLDSLAKVLSHKTKGINCMNHDIKILENHMSIYLEKSNELAKSFLNKVIKYLGIR